jgi:hypothetical protein
MWTIYVLLFAVYVRGQHFLQEAVNQPGYCEGEHECHSHDDQTKIHRAYSQTSNVTNTTNQIMDLFKVSCQKLIGNNNTSFLHVTHTQCRKTSSETRHVYEMSHCLCRIVSNGQGGWRLRPHCEELRVLQVAPRSAQSSRHIGRSLQGASKRLLLSA